MRYGTSVVDDAQAGRLGKVQYSIVVAGHSGRLGKVRYQCS